MPEADGALRPPAAVALKGKRGRTWRAAVVASARQKSINRMSMAAAQRPISADKVEKIKSDSPRQGIKEIICCRCATTDQNVAIGARRGEKRLTIWCRPGRVLNYRLKLKRTRTCDRNCRRPRLNGQQSKTDDDVQRPWQSQSINKRWWGTARPSPGRVRRRRLSRHTPHGKQRQQRAVRGIF